VLIYKEITSYIGFRVLEYNAITNVVRIIITITAGPDWVGSDPTRHPKYNGGPTL